MKYILDANIFIRSKNDMPFDIWLSFWDKMKTLINSGNVFSCNQIKAEIEKGKDDLTKWLINNAPKNFFINENKEIIEQYQITQNWAQSQKYRLKPSALEDFAIVADAYLVATAKAYNYTLVTYEKSNPNSKSRILIPDVCVALDVRYCDLNTMLRELKITI